MSDKTEQKMVEEMAFIKKILAYILGEAESGGFYCPISDCGECSQCGGNDCVDLLIYEAKNGDVTDYLYEEWKKGGGRKEETAEEKEPALTLEDVSKMTMEQYKHNRDKILKRLTDKKD